MSTTLTSYSDIHWQRKTKTRRKGGCYSASVHVQIGKSMNIIKGKNDKRWLHLDSLISGTTLSSLILQGNHYLS